MATHETISIPLSLGFVAVIDYGDAALVSGRSWHAFRSRPGASWYAKSNGLWMHRVITGAGPLEVPDHIDGDGLNNRRSNLRLGTTALNAVNRKRTRLAGRLRGAYRNGGGRWAARICERGVRTYLGSFDTEAEAHAAWLSEAVKRFGDWVPAELRNTLEPPGSLPAAPVCS